MFGRKLDKKLTNELNSTKNWQPYPQLYTRDTTLQFINNSTLEGTRSTLLQLLEHTPTGQVIHLKFAPTPSGGYAPYLSVLEPR